MSAHSALPLAVQDNLAALDQIADWIGTLDASAYARRVEVCFGSSVGGHLRHVLDHYLSLCAGLTEGRVDYATRQRDPRVESDPAHAGGVLGRVRAQLQALAGRFPGGAALQVRTEAAHEAVDWAPSSLLRELDFALSHTVHHLALIAVISQLIGQPTPPDFGVAPSTLRHRQAQAQIPVAAGT
jgi:uncharacterized damage-inducible protein DinB